MLRISQQSSSAAAKSYYTSGSDYYREGQELVQSKFSPDSPEDFVRKCQDLLRGAYPKLKVIILNDFTAYPDTVLEELAGAEACIW